MGSLLSLIFCRKSEVDHIGDMASCSVSTSTLGNAGATVSRFEFDDTSFCILNVNLPILDQKSRCQMLKDIAAKAFKSERDQQYK